MRSATSLIFAGLVVIAACGGRASLEDPDFTPIDPQMDGGLPDGQPPPPPKTCGDGVCQSAESCTTCPIDCGLCKTCGNGKCDSGETCASCAQDCGACPSCGDGFCNNGEDCLTCSPDCGVCPGCGDKICDAKKNENCFTCPGDCGKCMGCGDGTCNGNETCASCQQDCGVCSVCGNAKCEQFETCANCSQDCGMCQTLNCFQQLTCAFGCINLQAKPPTFSVSCVGTCVAKGCPDAQFFFDQAFSCAVTKGFQKCGGNLNCIMQACQPEITACLGSTCQ